MSKTHANTNNAMKHIYLNRELDRVAREEDYLYCPDEILINILDYTGDINEKSSGFYKVKVDYIMRRRFRPQYCIDEINYLSNPGNHYPDDYRIRMIKRLTENNWSEWYKSSTTLNYCGCCNRVYVGEYDSHIERLRHIKNMNKKGDLLLAPTKKFINFINNRANNKDYNYSKVFEFKNIKNIRFRECFY